MSCLESLTKLRGGNGYNPVPTKEWYRYENRCTYDTTIPLATVVYVPLLKQYVSNDALAYELSVLKKGNILQYKKIVPTLPKISVMLKSPKVLGQIELLLGELRVLVIQIPTLIV